jgi:ribosomal protein S21
LAEVTLQDGETVENALRRFKRKVLQENIIGEVNYEARLLLKARNSASSRRWPVNATARKLAGRLSKGKEGADGKPPKAIVATAQTRMSARLATRSPRPRRRAGRPRTSPAVKLVDWQTDA